MCTWGFSTAQSKASVQFPAQHQPNFSPSVHMWSKWLWAMWMSAEPENTPPATGVPRDQEGLDSQLPVFRSLCSSDFTFILASDHLPRVTDRQAPSTLFTLLHKSTCSLSSPFPQDLRGMDLESIKLQFIPVLSGLSTISKLGYDI